MTVYGVWNSVGAFAASGLEHLEAFPSIRAAKTVLLERFESNGKSRCDTFYTDMPNWPTYFPNVGRETACIDLYLYNPKEGDNGPDRRLVIGPRGGVKSENF